ncbi:oligosaccharide flippase family protein, partial [bacterium]|nr:oligosaccharide flippase family protein [bacterium]
TGEANLPLIPFFLLALLPAIGSIQSVGVEEARRKQKVWRLVSVQMLAQTVALAAAIILTQISQNLYIGALILLSIGVGNLIGGYLIAPRIPKWCWDSALTKKLFRFGIPLLVDSFILAAMRWGEFAIISAMVGIEAVGFWGATLMLTRNPFRVIGKVFNAMFLPRLSDAQEPVRRERLFRKILYLATVVHGFLFIGVSCLAVFLLVPLFKSEYEPARVLIIPGAAIAAIYSNRAIISLRILVSGKTKTLTFGSLVSGSGILGLLLLMILGLPLHTSLWALVAGEAVATLFWAFAVHRREGMHIAICTVLLVGFVFSASALMTPWFFPA